MYSVNKMDMDALDRALRFEGEMAAWFTVLLRDFPDSPHLQFYIEGERRHRKAGQSVWREYKRRIKST